MSDANAATEPATITRIGDTLVRPSEPTRSDERPRGSEPTRSERATTARLALLRGGVGGEALARALTSPDETREAIKAATLAGALDALSPGTMLLDSDRLKAIEVGAKIAGLYSDATVVVNNTVVSAFGQMSRVAGE